jgi:hypothetical protein
MDRMSGKLTVFFEDPFWVGIFERTTDKNYMATNINSIGIMNGQEDNTIRVR